MARSIKGGDCGEMDFNAFLCFVYWSLLLHAKICLSPEMSSCSVSRESLGVLRSESLEVVPLVEHLPTKELDSVSPLVLWSIFDGDNIEYHPRRWIGLWTEEEDSMLSQILRVCHRAIQRPFLASGDLLQVGLSIYVVVVCRDLCFGDHD